MKALWLAWLLCVPAGFGATDPEWDTAVARLTENKPAEAIPLFEAWISRAQSQGIRSPEAHHDLASAYLLAQQPGPAAYHLATSAQLRTDPFYTWSAIKNLARIQHRILIQDNLASRWSFRLSLLLKPTLLFSVTVIGFWIFAFGCFLGPSRRGALTLGISFLVVCAAGYATLAVLPRYAVVLPGPEGSVLNSEPVLGSEKKIAELPVGTLVALGATQDHVTAISAPFAGWLPTSAVKPLTR